MCPHKTAATNYATAATPWLGRERSDDARMNGPVGSSLSSGATLR